MKITAGFPLCTNSLDQILPWGPVWRKEMLHNSWCSSRKPQGSPLTLTQVDRRKEPKFCFCFFPFLSSCSGYLRMGRLGGGKEGFSVKGDSHQPRRARAGLSEGGRLSACRVTQLDPRLAGKADGAVQFRTAAEIFHNISHFKISLFFQK